jgi:hypothetical protein
MYEIQTYTLMDGWINTWHTNGTPTVFKSFGEALDELDEHLADLEANGMEEDRNNFRIKFEEIN